MRPHKKLEFKPLSLGKLKGLVRPEKAGHGKGKLSKEFNRNEILECCLWHIANGQITDQIEAISMVAELALREQEIRDRYILYILNSEEVLQTPLLKHPNEDVRSAVLSSLSRIITGMPDHMASLDSFKKADEDTIIRPDLMRKTFAIFEEAFGDEHIDIRRCAIYHLRQIGMMDAQCATRVLDFLKYKIPQDQPQSVLNTVGTHIRDIGNQHVNADTHVAEQALELILHFFPGSDERENVSQGAIFGKTIYRPLQRRVELAGSEQAPAQLM